MRRRKFSRNRLFRWLLACSAATALSIAGCEKATPPDPTVSGSVATYGEMPTDEQCHEFAKALAEALASEDAAAVNRLVDQDAILDRATAGIEISVAKKRGFVTGAKSALNGPNNLLSQISAQANKGKNYKLLRIHTVGEQKRALFRLLSEAAGVNYHDFVLVRQSDGKVRAADVYFVLAAEMLSQNIRRGYIALAAEESRSVLDKLTKAEGDLVKHIGKVQQMSKSARSAPQEALTIYRQLPDSLQKDKNILLIRMMAARSVDEMQYDEAMRDFRTYHPNDPCVDLVGLDSLFIHKRYPQARAALDRLDKSLGGDPYLDVLRATSYSEEKQYKKAMECARKAIAAEKDLEQAHWILITAALKQKDFAEVTRALIVLEKDLGLEIGDLTTLDEYAEFVKSPQYQEWLKRKR
jgi:tetratricopeptide (TPR) repeat protein